MNKYIIVSRHAGAIEWIKSKGYKGQVMSHFSGSVVPGATYVGTIPIHKINKIICGGGNVIVLCLPKLKYKKRGADLSCDEMCHAGATLCVVENIQLREIVLDEHLRGISMWYDETKGVWVVVHENSDGEQIGKAKYFIKETSMRKYVDKHQLSTGLVVEG